MAPQHLCRGSGRSMTTTFLLACCLMLLVASSAHAGPTLRGVQVHALWPDVDEAQMDRELDLARGANANVIRVDVGWASLEDQAKGRWNSWYLPRLDHLVNGAAARGMQVIATVWGTPCWASSAPDTVKQGCKNPNWWGVGVQYPPAHNSDFADVTRFIAARYGTKLAAVEVWNEPNEGTRFLNAPDQAVAYAGLVKAGYAGVKSGDAGVAVIAGALAKADDGFLTRLFAAGIRGSYDGLSIHPYNEWRSPLVDGQDTLNSFGSGIAAVHAAQVAAGDTTPLWITEFGWTTATGTNWSVDSAQQAAYTGQAFEVLAGLPYVKAATVYELRDRSADPADFESNFGMVTASYVPKPAYDALRTALAGPTTAPPVPVAPVSTPTAASTRSATPDTAAAAKPATRSKPRAAVLSVSARHTASGIVAEGRAPRRAYVRLTVTGCHKAGALKLRVRTSDAGRFRRSVGRAANVRSCRIVAATHNLHASTLVFPRRTAKRARVSTPAGASV